MTTTWALSPLWGLEYVSDFGDTTFYTITSPTMFRYQLDVGSWIHLNIRVLDGPDKLGGRLYTIDPV